MEAGTGTGNSSHRDSLTLTAKLEPLCLDVSSLPAIWTMCSPGPVGGPFPCRSAGGTLYGTPAESQDFPFVISLSPLCWISATTGTHRRCWKNGVRPESGPAGGQAGGKAPPPWRHQRYGRPGLCLPSGERLLEGVRRVRQVSEFGVLPRPLGRGRPGVGALEPVSERRAGGALPGGTGGEHSSSGALRKYPRLLPAGIHKEAQELAGFVEKEEEQG